LNFFNNQQIIEEIQVFNATKYKINLGMMLPPSKNERNYIKAQDIFKLSMRRLKAFFLK
jgi:hypothetical protein